MMRRILVDSDVVLDVATGRQPFVEASQIALSYFENSHAIGVLSAHSVTNIYYILRKLGSDPMARCFLRAILEYLSIGAVDHKTIDSALESKFLDFEDGVQHYCAINNQCDAILTRNINDYQFSEIQVMTPKEFIALYQSPEQEKTKG